MIKPSKARTQRRPPADDAELRKSPVDRERAASMADEGGAAAAEVEAQPGRSRCSDLAPPEPVAEGGEE